MSRKVAKTLGMLTAASMLLLGGCSSGAPGAGEKSPDGGQGGGGGGTTTEPAPETSGAELTKVTITVEPSAIPAFIAEDEGFFEGVDVEVSTVGYDEAESLLVTGDTQIAWMGPLDAAEFSSQGEDFRYLSTAGALNMINGVVVRAEDAGIIKDVTDLKGKKLGIPGFGTGTWATFTVFADLLYDIDQPEEYFDVITSDSGALLALLEKGEIDGALLFAAQAAAGGYMEQFERLFSFTDLMDEKFGVPLVVNGAVVSQAWYDENEEAAQAVIAGLDRAVQWMAENADEFREDGKYADYARGDGWHRSEETTQGILSLLAEGKWFLTSADYDDEWRTDVYELIKAGEGVLVDKVPPLDEIFID